LVPPTAGSVCRFLAPAGIPHAAAVLALAYAVAVWRNLMGVQLGPDSVVSRGPFGTLTVPWDALAPGYPLPAPPAATHLTVEYARPELVHRRGLIRRGRIRVDDVDPMFLAAAVAFYAANAQRRPAIGTHEEYHRLIRARPEATRRSRPPVI
jgi:hypothetical protein